MHFLRLHKLLVLAWTNVCLADPLLLSHGLPAPPVKVPICVVLITAAVRDDEAAVD